MSVQEATTGNAVLEDESESGLKKEKLPLTEDEDAFKGPRFYPPVYRRRYAAVCELVKKHQAKKVLLYYSIRYLSLGGSRGAGVGGLLCELAGGDVPLGLLSPLPYTRPCSAAFCNPILVTLFSTCELRQGWHFGLPRFYLGERGNPIYKIYGYVPLWREIMFFNHFRLR